MPRQPRLAYPGALYHITSRGVQQSAIFIDDRDRSALLALIASTLPAYEARTFAYCLMGNHYHLVLETRQPNLSALMHRINAIYSQSFNRRHGRQGHLMEGRFKALHVDRDNYLLQVCRYVDLNPVRAGLASTPLDWPWSSYRAHIGLSAAPRWLATSELLGALTGVAPDSDAEMDAARRLYACWVDEGRGVRLWSQALRHGLYVGDEAFAERISRGES